MGHARPHRGQSQRRAPVNGGPADTCDRASHARQAAISSVGDLGPPSTSVLAVLSLVMVHPASNSNDARNNIVPNITVSNLIDYRGAVTKSYSALDLDMQLCFPLYATTRAVTRRYGELLAEVGLTYPQYLVMLALWFRSPQTVGELGTASGSTQAR